MEFMLDTLNLEEIKKWSEVLPLAGVTSNPTIAEKEGKASVNEIRDRLNFGRKLTVQLMEYFDRTGFLRRKGNDHILRDKNVFDL